MHKKMVLFGAGKIGRSFIGQLFSSGGYEVVFIDMFQPLIDELNRRGSYTVILKGATESIIEVSNVRGVFAGDEEKVVSELSDADIVATAVGQSGLHGVFPLLAKGLIARNNQYPDRPTDIIIAENLRNAAAFFETELKKLLPEGYPFGRLVGLVETSIGKMVPLMTQKDLQKDLLQVFAEHYNTLILDKKVFNNPIPVIAGLAPKENMKAWVDRKLFIHNLGHAAAAYFGHLYNPAFIFIYQALDVQEIAEKVRGVMLQSATALQAKYPSEFSMDDLERHIDDLIERFSNRALGDTIFRVGCDLFRKLGSDDRLSGAIRMAMETGRPYDKIVNALLAGFRFRATDEDGKMLPADLEFAMLYDTGIQNVLTRVCGFSIEFPNTSQISGPPVYRRLLHPTDRT